MIYFFIAIASVGICWVAYRGLVMSKRRQSSNIETSNSDKPESLGPERFLKEIKNSLPKNMGFVYEVSTDVLEKGDLEYRYSPERGDFVVDVKIIDPMTGEELKELRFNERLRSYPGPSNEPNQRIASAIHQIMKEREIESLKGHREIIS